MIRVDRKGVVAPPSLDKSGKSEEKAVITALDAYVKQVPPSGKPFTFPFKAYKKDDVKQALSQLFHGKCAYCESRYAGTQPMDVEHWRPKGGVAEPGQTGLALGYPWLAARWTNLLPSCIDCNRPRVQHDDLTGLDETLGKANQFPVVGSRMQRPVPDGVTPVDDIPLLIDPTVDDPSVHLRFRDDGIVIALTDMGRQSIRVYALNRSELVLERLGLARLIEQRLTTIEFLASVIVRPGLQRELKRDLQDLAAHEIDALMELAEPGRPYSAMARQLIWEGSPLESPAPPLPKPWPSEVADMLERLGDMSHTLALASRLVGLGFQPQVPTSAAYVRWTVTGTQRSITLYQNGSGLVSDSKAQVAFAKSVPGRETLASPRVRYTYQHAQLGAVLDAVVAFRRWADQP
jgi:uncharacterized protein (TIGR02646 family)